MADRSNALKKIAELRVEITRHDQLYYAKAAPEISDTEYDLLLAELEQLEAVVSLSSHSEFSCPVGRCCGVQRA